ncbi:MAG: 50S ribosomal protein L13 [bacterium (Candidatus Ratteibacteria) CG_4_10_14_3_um_filter_41_18]|uniref:Large ribosomal subunit protein uL13 n=4 Tax=Candidatus Ratteibacteria TaxID=2979319 RepID=A0A2M7E7K2_9BACT|nr:MAG: 50S ribosomal protein L13 [bacterium (Candidatus Ratteibacteria) CG01_land_8_20_14_3_00_40_19]PIW31622.1 MAG: 50S ribosomal protein L13 [bacterium (Candidatus Ratteibacteria) CG15_BIG_FIL_POST_REV_8_21_14_020_41_12]PIW74218.1 MAG: 50S ribosomal protein L13 [bacterium (Candidatus Ratteibacteria) CG_4_8_14_3_um_filter_41_36]PIX77179.1 MAG: 50S ribosomal protein L13 [bacterium (Candidatus Ratteibacteria) CG_4_10_14_3_um_filter_41_18]PJA62633.1 MAG: 50S ribosomal protein L13 [bacterium (Can
MEKEKLKMQRNWFLVDAQDKILGRIATKIATALSGKNKPSYSPWLDGGDFVVVINSEKIKVTGKKIKDKLYYKHSGYPGGLKTITFERLQKKNPETVIRLAVKGMLPKNKTQAKRMKRLKVYSGEKHPHQAQKLQLLK